MRAQRLLRQHRLATVVAAVVAPLAVAALLTPLRSTVTPATSALALVAVVVAFSTTGLRAAGLAAVLSATIGFDFFLTEPYGSLVITDPDDIEVAVLLLVIGGIVTETALWGQRNEAALSREVGYVDGVLATAESVAGDPGTPEDHARTISMRMREVLDLDSCRFEEGGAVEPFAYSLNHDGSVTTGGRTVDVDRDGLPVDAVVVLPVISGGHVRGRFLLTAASHVARPSERQRRVAVLLADQILGTLGDTKP